MANKPPPKAVRAALKAATGGKPVKGQMGKKPMTAAEAVQLAAVNAARANRK